MRRLREQHELRASAIMAAARQRSENPIRQYTGSKITENSTSSTLQLLSHSNNNSHTNGSHSANGAKNYGNLLKKTSGDNQVENTDNPITVTTLKKLEQEMNYLELCYSS